MAEEIFFKFGMWPNLSGGKFGAIRTTHHTTVCLDAHTNINTP